MAIEALQKPLGFRYVSSTRYRELQGESVEASYSPINPRIHRPFAIVTHLRSEREGKKGFPQLIQTTGIHRRSFELHYNESGYIISEDEFGNIYGMFTVKGGNVQEIRAFMEDDAPSGVVVWGIQDSDSTRRQKRGADIARSLKIDTELIHRVLEPKKLPIKGKLLPLHEVKQRMLEQIYKDNAEPLEEIPRGMRQPTRWEMPKVAEALMGMTFFETLRSVQVSERLADLSYDHMDQDDFRKIMTHVFQFVNLREEVLSNRNPAHKLDHYDFENKEDLFRYFTEYLPDQMGKNYGKLHKAGLLHIFPHLGNISLAGSIYDLDSISGEPLGIGDEPITEQQIAEELVYLLVGDDNHTFAGGASILVHVLEDQGFIKGGEAQNKFLKNFLLRYCKERGWEDDILTNISRIFSMYGVLIEEEAFREVNDYYLDIVTKQLGWDYRYEHGPEILVRDYFASNLENFDGQPDPIELLLASGGLSIKVASDILYKGRSYVWQAIMRDRAKELERLEVLHDEDTRRAVAVMFAEREYKAAYPKLLNEIRDDNEDFERIILQQYFVAKGWDDYIFSDSRLDEALKPFGDKYILMNLYSVGKALNTMLGLSS